MQDIATRLSVLTRPRLLTTAARLGLKDYKRKRDLARCLESGTLPGHGAAIMQLLEIEDRMNDLRLTGDTGYSPSRHVTLLIAVMGEAQAYLAAQEDRLERA